MSTGARKVTRRQLSDWLSEASEGNHRIVGKLISILERADESAADLAELSFKSVGDSWVLGVTGAPGAGKSTLIGSLIAHLSEIGLKVAVLAVDPTSPNSGGAFLGDRIRMSRLSADGVYVRSMASRSSQGGLAHALPSVIRMMRFVGFPVVIIETVGVGQAEFGISSLVDTTAVVVTPAFGDALQVAKAGLLEVGDVYVVNKADLPGCYRTCQDLESMLDMGPKRAWRPPIMPVEAARGVGTAAFWASVKSHGQHLRTSGELHKRRLAGLSFEVQLAAISRLESDIMGANLASLLQDLLADVQAGRMAPQRAGAALASHLRCSDCGD